MKLQNIKVIDLTSSVIDKEKSNPKAGDYVFISKRPVSYTGAGPRPNWFFTWERYSPETRFREIAEAKTRGFSFVLAGVDPYWPDSVVPDAEGKYVYGDLVLMKCLLIDELERRVENMELSQGAANAKINSFKQQVRSGGGEISDELLNSL